MYSRMGVQLLQIGMNLIRIVMSKMLQPNRTAVRFNIKLRQFMKIKSIKYEMYVFTWKGIVVPQNLPSLFHKKSQP